MCAGYPAFADEIGLTQIQTVAPLKLSVMSGVLLDNTSKHEEAIKAYTKYLHLCEELGDTRGVALAANCIGVGYQVRCPSNGAHTTTIY